MSRALLLAAAAVLTFAACSSSSTKGFTGSDAGSSGTSGDGGTPKDGGSTSGAPTDGPAPLARGAVDARLSGANCQDRLALKFGTISPVAVLNSGDPNGGDAVTIGCTVTAATGAYSVSFAVASGVSFGVRGTSDKPSAVLGNEASQYNADACTVQTSDVALDHVIGSIQCASTTTGSGSSGNPTPSPCELDADFAVYGCVVR
jgi:hypothetical protein